MKKTKVREQFLTEMRRIPIVQVGCEKVGVSRNSVYRWRNEDEAFRKEMDLAMAEGEALVNDMSESQLLSLIKDKNWQAIRFWLERRNPKFREKLDVAAKIENRQEQLTPEEEEIVRQALGRVTIHTSENKNE